MERKNSPEEDPDHKRHSTWQPYSVISERLYHPDLGYYHTYGIRVDANHTIHDVSTYEDVAAHIVALINHANLPPALLNDVVSDMLP